MILFHTPKQEFTWDIQQDSHLFNGGNPRMTGPDRAWLIDAATQETVGLWITDAPAAAKIVTEVLGMPDHQTSPARPWYIQWVRGGKLAVKKHFLSLDRGALLLIELVDYDLLDRRRHLTDGA